MGKRKPKKNKGSVAGRQWLNQHWRKVRKAIKEAKLIHAGKLKSRSLDEFLNEL